MNRHATIVGLQSDAPLVRAGPSERVIE